jgi:energy-coupling factor transport system ATP-binding protein
VKGILRAIKHEGYTIVVAEHRLYYLKDLCDRVIVMKDGRIDRELTGEKFRRQSNESLNRAGLRSIHLDQLTMKNTGLQLGEPILELKDICFSYKKSRPLISGITMNVRRGEILGIVGRNGRGKTTLLEIICGMKQQQQGDISIRGKRRTKRDRIGHAYLVMQDNAYQLFTESVEKEIFLGSRPGEGLQEKGMDVLSRMNLSTLIDRHPASLSGGQKQRLCIAVSYMKDADIICFDEPTSGLDYNSMRRVDALLTGLAAEGKAIIVTTHDQEFLLSCCTRVYEMGERR